MYLHIYSGSPTAGGSDGQLLSEGDHSAPVTIGPLNASTNQVSSPVKMAVRADVDGGTGKAYLTAAVTTITPTGTTASDWALAPDNGGSAGTFGAYGAALTLVAGITNTNTIFWAMAKAVNGENPSTDISVGLHVVCATINLAS